MFSAHKRIILIISVIIIIIVSFLVYLHFNKVVDVESNTTSENVVEKVNEITNKDQGTLKGTEHCFHNIEDNPDWCDSVAGVKTARKYNQVFRFGSLSFPHHELLRFVEKESRGYLDNVVKIGSGDKLTENYALGTFGVVKVATMVEDELVGYTNLEEFKNDVVDYYKKQFSENGFINTEVTKSHEDSYHFFNNEHNNKSAFILNVKDTSLLRSGQCQDKGESVLDSKYNKFCRLQAVEFKLIYHQEVNKIDWEEEEYISPSRKYRAVISNGPSFTCGGYMESRCILTIFNIETGKVYLSKNMYSYVGSKTPKYYGWNEEENFLIESVFGDAGTMVKNLVAVDFINSTSSSVYSSGYNGPETCFYITYNDVSYVFLLKKNNEEYCVEIEERVNYPHNGVEIYRKKQSDERHGFIDLIKFDDLPDPDYIGILDYTTTGFDIPVYKHSDGVIATSTIYFDFKTESFSN